MIYNKLPKSMGTGVYLTERSAACRNTWPNVSTICTLCTPPTCVTKLRLKDSPRSQAMEKARPLPDPAGMMPT